MRKKLFIIPPSKLTEERKVRCEDSDKKGRVVKKGGRMKQHLNRITRRHVLLQIALLPRKAVSDNTVNEASHLLKTSNEVCLATSESPSAFGLPSGNIKDNRVKLGDANKNKKGRPMQIH